VHPRCQTRQHIMLRIGLACAVLAVLCWRADQRRTSPLVSWVGLTGWVGLWVGPPLWTLVSSAPVCRALAGLRQMSGGTTRWQTATMAPP